MEFSLSRVSRAVNPFLVPYSESAIRSRSFLWSIRQSVCFTMSSSEIRCCDCCCNWSYVTLLCSIVTHIRLNLDWVHVVSCKWYIFNRFNNDITCFYLLGLVKGSARIMYPMFLFVHIKCVTFWDILVFIPLLLIKLFAVKLILIVIEFIEQKSHSFWSLPCYIGNYGGLEYQATE